LITDFTPGTIKYVFKGIADFAVTPPVVITGDSYFNYLSELDDLVLLMDELKPILGLELTATPFTESAKSTVPFKIDDCVLMVETKAKKEMQDTIVLAKADAAIRWCRHASDYLLKHDGKKWRYLLVPHDDVSEQNTLLIYVQKYEIKVSAK